MLIDQYEDTLEILNRVLDTLTRVSEETQDKDQSRIEFLESTFAKLRYSLSLGTAGLDAEYPSLKTDIENGNVAARDFLILLNSYEEAIERFESWMNQTQRELRNKK